MEAALLAKDEEHAALRAKYEGALQEHWPRAAVAAPCQGPC